MPIGQWNGFPALLGRLDDSVWFAMGEYAKTGRPAYASRPVCLAAKMRATEPE